MTIAFFYAAACAMFLVVSTKDVPQKQRGVLLRLGRLLGFQEPNSPCLVPCRIAVHPRRSRGES